MFQWESGIPVPILKYLDNLRGLIWLLSIGRHVFASVAVCKNGHKDTPSRFYMHASLQGDLAAPPMREWWSHHFPLESSGEFSLFEFRLSRGDLL